MPHHIKQYAVFLRHLIFYLFAHLGGKAGYGLFYSGKCCYRNAIKQKGDCIGNDRTKRPF